MSYQVTRQYARLWLSCLLWVSVALSAAAQEHIEFLGITMGKPVDDFVSELTSNGFKALEEKQKGKRPLQGDFNGSTVMLTVNYGVHTLYPTSVEMRFAEIKDFREFLNFYEAMKRVITEQYCTEGEVISEQGDMNTLPTYGMQMDYGKAVISIDPDKAFQLILTYTDQYNTIEERKRRYD